MARRIEEYVKYTKAELDTYVSTPGSCVHKANLNRHYALEPYVLGNLKKALPAYILKNEISYYDESSEVKGVLLSLKNIKVLNGIAAIRGDDPHLHVDINADCYIFRPEVGAELTGVIKHITRHHVSVILYRVFNAHIIFPQKISKDQFTLGQDLKFRVRKFNLNGMFVNIHGELLASPEIENEPKTPKNPKRVVFADHGQENSSTDSDSEKERKLVDLDELLESIKNEPLSEEETPKQKSKATKRKINKRGSSTESNGPHNSEKERLQKSSKTSQRSESLEKSIKREIKNENQGED